MKLQPQHLLLLLFLNFNAILLGQNELLKSGPMVGYSAYREVLIWVQTTKEAEVAIRYTDTLGISNTTKPVKTVADNNFIAKIFPKPLTYGTKYTYQVLINNKPIALNYSLSFETQTLWQFRTNPPDFKFAIGSCFYANEPKDDRPGKAYGGNYKIFENILNKNPNFMLWLGDNVYLRTPDFLTKTGLTHRYNHVRALPKIQPLLGSIHHYATWDDHDYGPNDANKSYANKKITEKLFNDYWGNLNTNVTGKGGITSHFLWSDVEFFLLDNRYHRDARELKTENKAYFGDAQIDWLINALASSKATFKIVVSGGQIISNAAVYENYAVYAKERENLLKRLHTERIEGVLFFSGDRHHTEISKMNRDNAYPLIDITCSPLTSGIHKPRDEGNTYQLKNKTFYDRNFGIVSLSGERKNRILTLTIYDADGQKVWDYTIKAKDLKY